MSKHAFRTAALLVLLLFSLSAWPGDAYWVDVRSPGEYRGGHVSEAVNIPHTEITQRISEVTTDPDATLYLYCRSGNRSGKAKKALEQAGFTSVVNVGGYRDAVKMFEELSASDAAEQAQ
ncbi:MAG: rhodanese-like domain-containing protein [Xanthomonadales bacterium]|jgi:phage shock protein E|nr:rhodanese-like domain-containing protein [Xanthomonadales bacterium]